jgi:hypothetical protein
MTRGLKQPSSGSASCSWCGRPFQLRQSGGHAQRFWTVEAIEAGVLGIDQIRKGVQPTCTLPQRPSALQS